MQEYTSFASVYDKFMDNVPYEEWAEYVISILHQYSIEDGLVCDLGCGTGSLTEILAAKGYDMIGIDMSVDMLDEAMKKRDQSGADILYLCQDMREMELYGTVRAIVSICDSMNYILDADDMAQVARLACNYLDYDGIFIFDMNTEYKYREVLSDNTFAENRSDAAFIWENTYDEETRINEYALTLFIKENADEGVGDDDCGSDEEYDYSDDGKERFVRFTEYHEQRAYSIEEVKKMLTDAGLIVEGVYDAFTFEEPRTESERVYFVARRPQP